MKKYLGLALLSCFALSMNAAGADTLSVSNLTDVVVTGTRSATTARNIPYTVSVIGKEALNKQHYTNVLPTLTEQVPGLFVTQRGMLGYGVSTGAAGAISMRGLSAGSGQMMVLIDGHPQYQGIFGHSISDAYQTLSVERVEVLRGPASVLYGSNAMGGVMNIITNRFHPSATTQKGRTEIGLSAGSYGTVQASVNNSLRVGRFSSNVSAQYGRTDNHRPNMGFEQYGGIISLGYDISKHWNAFANVNIKHFNASQPGTVKSPMIEADQRITRGVAMLGVEHHYDKFSGSISAYDNFGIHKINDGYAVGGKPQTELFRSKDALAGISWYETMALLPGNSITVGMDYQHIYGRAYYTSRTTGETVMTGRRKMQSTHAHCNEVAGYIDLRQNLMSWLTIDAGVRYDHHSVAGGEWIPQAGIVARPMKNGEIRATATKGFRNPTPKDLYLYGSANRELNAERLWNYELSWKHSLLEGNLCYGVNLFLIDGDNILAQAADNKFYNTGEIKNRGAEVEATWRINSHWRLSTNHSFLNMKKHVLAAPEYKGYLGADMQYGKWSATMGLQQLCGLFTEVGKNERKTNATLLNMTVNYQVLKPLQLWVRGDNLLAHRYEINAGYPMPRATFMAGVVYNLPY